MPRFLKAVTIFLLTASVPAGLAAQTSSLSKAAGRYVAGAYQGITNSVIGGPYATATVNIHLPHPPTQPPTPPAPVTTAVTASNAHGQGDYVMSGTGGLYEAAYDANANGGGVVVVDPSSGATATNVTNARALYANVGIEDEKTAANGIASPS